MASQFDDSDFIDREYQSSQGPYSATPGVNGGGISFRPPSRQELETRAATAQQQLAELKRAQEALERERATLEEARRRRAEFHTGREEMLQHLTRGVGLLEHSEHQARREAEQMAKTLAGLRAALAGVSGLKEEEWTQDNWNVELSKALAIIESSRMEWNQARLKWALLESQSAAPGAEQGSSAPTALFQGQSFWELCKLGVALTWPVALVGLLGVILFAVLRAR